MKRLISPSSNTGREATIKVGPCRGEWGIIKDYDGEFYHIALWGGDDSLLIFEPSEVKVKT